MKTKSVIRAEMQAQIKNLSIEGKEQIENILFNKLTQSQSWQQSDVIGLTMSLPQEWNTLPIIEYGLKDDKIIVLPKSNMMDKTMIFYEISNLNHLEPGYGGILEPASERCKVVEFSAIDLLVVPGFAYDKRGYRIGFGGGFYDRFLTSFKGKTVSLAAQFQILDKIPINQYDQKVNQILTDKNTYNL